MSMEPPRSGLGAVIRLAIRFVGGTFIFFGVMGCLGAFLGFREGEQGALVAGIFALIFLVVGIRVFGMAGKISERFARLFADPVTRQAYQARMASRFGDRDGPETAEGPDEAGGENSDRRADRRASGSRRERGRPESALSAPRVVSGRLGGWDASRPGAADQRVIKAGKGYRLTAGKVLVLGGSSARGAIGLGLALMLPAVLLELARYYGLALPEAGFFAYAAFLVGLVLMGKRGEKRLDGMRGVFEGRRRAWFISQTIRHSLSQFDRIRLIRVRIPFIGGSAPVRGARRSGPGAVFLVQLAGGRQRVSLDFFQDYRAARELASVAAGVSGLPVAEE